tara:strand:- start:3768 stop:4019 length:252 start_codon:yes stop_codon:yes gene_type:complete
MINIIITQVISKVKVYFESQGVTSEGAEVGVTSSGIATSVSGAAWQAHWCPLQPTSQSGPLQHGKSSNAASKSLRSNNLTFII